MSLNPPLSNSAHPTKEELREKIAYFIAEKMDLCKAREIEEEVKCKMGVQLPMTHL